MTTDLLQRSFRFMCVVRHVEERLLGLFSEGKLSGTTHTGIGQEAVAAALWATLEGRDVLFSSHRCHGHFLASGGAPTDLFSEIMGRQSPLCGGRGGSQHLHLNNFYSNGVQGGTAGNATGIALAERMKQSGAVTVAMLGDGTLGEGLVYESFNFASLHSLPILYLLEDNGYAQSTPRQLTVSGSMTGRATAFGIDAEEIETNDVTQLVPVVQRCLAAVRQQRPMLLVVHTYRLSPHSKGDDTRDVAEIDAWRNRDPLRLARAHLPADVADRIDREAKDEVDAAVAEAERVCLPAIGDHGPLRTVPAGPYPPAFATDPVTYVHSINRAILDVLDRRPECVLLGEDILDPYGGAFKATQECSTRFPTRTITTPISEAGIVAWSTGAALRGMRPIAEIMFGDFLTLAADQIVNHASKYRWMYGGSVSVPLVIRTPMGGRRGYGPTHSQSIEAMFAGVPGLTIVAPSHLVDPGHLLERAVTEVDDPVLFVENKLLYAQRLQPVTDGRIGQFFVRTTNSCFPTLHLSLSPFDPPDLVMVTYGGSVPAAMDAARRLLLDEERLCDLVIPSLIAPLPMDEIGSFVGRAGKVVVFEEGVKRGGWGAELVASLSERPDDERRWFLRIGAPDSPLPSSKTLEAALLPDATQVVRLVTAWLAATDRSELYEHR